MPALATCEAAPPKKVRLTFIEDFILSGTAAVTSKTVAAPIERIKMVVQTQGAMIKAGTLEKEFTGIMDCGKWIVREEGFAAFWKSNFTNCLRYFPTQALNFAFKGRIKQIFKTELSDPAWLQVTKNIIGGGMAGGASLCFVYSLDYARTRLASDLKSKGGKRQYSGLIDVYKQTLKTDGFVGLYRGFNISFVGIFVYRGFYFGLYDSIVPNMPDNIKENAFAKFAVGYVVTVVSGLLSYPIDTIRRRMMMTSGMAKADMYKGSIDCAAKIMKAEGFMSFMKGAGANILRGIAGAGVLAGFDELKKFYAFQVYGTRNVY